MTRAFVATVVGLSFAAGCAHRHPSNRLERTQEPTPSERVVVTAGSPIHFGEVVTRMEGRILHVQVLLENTSTKDQSFEYRWEWTDADGFQLGDTLSSWQPAFIGGKEHKLLNGAGPGPSAVNFRLYIRKPGH